MGNRLHTSRETRSDLTIRAVNWRDFIICARKMEPIQSSVCAAVGISRLDAIIAHTGQAWTAVDACGRVVAVFGCDTLPTGAGAPWLYATKRLAAHRRAFVGLWPMIVRGWLGEFPRLVGVVAESNTAYLRWLGRCGVELHPPVFIQGANFIPFVIQWPGIRS